MSILARGLASALCVLAFGLGTAGADASPRTPEVGTAAFCSHAARYTMPPGVEVTAEESDAAIPGTDARIDPGPTIAFDLLADPFAGRPEPKLADNFLFLGSLAYDRTSGDVTLDGRPLSDREAANLQAACVTVPPSVTP